jgi:hypothetical protein
MHVTISGFVAIPYLAIQLFITFRNDGHIFVANCNTYAVTRSRNKAKSVWKYNKPEDIQCLRNFTTFSRKLSFSNPV